MRGKVPVVMGAMALVLAFGARAADTPAAVPPAVLGAAAMQAQNAADLKWAPAEVLPPGAMLAVLHQNSNTGGVDLLMKVESGDYRVPPHWHTPNELVTVISGTFLTESAGMKHTLTSGGYMYLPAKTAHEAWCKGGCLLQISGDGTFDVNYVNPADEPETYKAMKAKAAKEQKQ